MAEELTTSEDQQFDDIDRAMLLGEIDEEEEEEEEQPRRRGRPPGSKNKKKGKPASRETVERQKSSRAMDVDEWIAFVDERYGWGQPGVECHLERISPMYFKGVTTGGLVDVKEGSHFTPGEIKSKHGGGQYKLIGKIPGNGAKYPPLTLTKTFTISGNPIVDSDSVDLSKPNSSNNNNNASNAELDVTHPVAQRGLIGLVEKAHAQAYEQSRGPDVSHIMKPYQEAMSAMQRGYEDRTRMNAEMAQQQVAAAEQRIKEAKLEAEAKEREKQRIEEDARRRVREATEGSTSLLNVLIPSINDSASRQVESITTTFNAREASIEQRHAQELESQRRYHESQISQLQMLQQAEVSRMQATFESQLGLLQQQLQHYQQQAQILQAESMKLRDELMQLRVTQIESLRTQQDPITKIGEYQQLMEIMKDITRSDNVGSDDLPEDASPILKVFNNAVNKFSGPLAAVLEAKAGSAPVGMSPEHQTALIQHQQMAAMQQQQQQLVPVQPPQPEKPKGTQVNKEDLVTLINLVGEIYKSGNTSAEQTAHSAMQYVPHDVLRELAKRDPEKLLSNLDKEGLLIGTPLVEDEGRKFAIVVLSELRKNL